MRPASSSVQPNDEAHSLERLRLGQEAVEVYQRVAALRQRAADEG
jgi:hypothetical protein